MFKKPFLSDFVTQFLAICCGRMDDWMNAKTKLSQFAVDVG